MSSYKAIEELRAFVIDRKSKMQTLAARASSKRNTDKWKTCKTTCRFFLTRLQSLHDLLNSGGNMEDMAATEDPLILKNIYDPVINYWSNELKK